MMSLRMRARLLLALERRERELTPRLAADTASSRRVRSRAANVKA